MKRHSFRYQYHDAQLAGFTLGPRRELTLQIALDPVWNKAAVSPVSTPDDMEAIVRFGDIQNYEAVVAYFGKLPAPQPNGYIAAIEGFTQSEKGSRYFLLGIEDYGGIEIHSEKFTED